MNRFECPIQEKKDGIALDMLKFTAVREVWIARSYELSEVQFLPGGGWGVSPPPPGIGPRLIRGNLLL